jgi:NTE family protein
MLRNESYVLNSENYSLGLLTEAVISNRPLFNTHKSTLLSAPAFNPLQDSKSLYLENFRANSYGAFGMKNVFHLFKNLDFRLEGYLFQPLRAFELKDLQSVEYSAMFKKRYYAATAGLVYNTFTGPISFSLNHYSEEQRQLGMMLHIGFLIYNKRSFE